MKQALYITGLRDGRWYVRYACARRLASLTGRVFGRGVLWPPGVPGTVEPPASAREEVVRRWELWLKNRGG